VLPSGSVQAKRNKKAYQRQDAIPAMTLSELASLPLNRRAEYVRLMRKAAVHLEGFQSSINFHSRANYAALERAYRSLYASILLSDDAVAQSSQDTDPGSMNQRCPDQCIFGFGLSTYVKISEACPDYPLGCVKPDDRKCQVGNTQGIICDPVFTGLDQTRSTSCKTVSRTATKDCYTQMTEVDRSTSEEAKKAVDRANFVFKFGIDKEGKNFEITAADLVKPEATQAINDLAKYAFDDYAYAQLIGVIELYRRNGVTPPAISPHGAQLWTGISQRFTDLGKSVDQIFDGFLDLCLGQDSPADPDRKEMRGAKLGAEVVARIRANKGKTFKTSVETSYWRALANRLDEVENAGQVPTNLNVLQKDECLTVIDRHRKLKTRVEGVRGTLPTGPSPIPPKPELPTDPKPTTAPVPTEPPKPVDEVRTESLGCPGALGEPNDPKQIDHNKLYSSAAQCLVCATEKAVQNSDKSLDLFEEPTQKKVNGDYRASRKWLSLLSTMAMACGHARSDHTVVEAAEMQWYIETFGHCDSDVYDWDGTPNAFFTPGQDKEDSKLVKEWASRSYWVDLEMNKRERKRKGKKIERPLDPDRKSANYDVGEFSRIYGMSYRQATQIFCNPDNFNGRKNRKGGYLEKVDGPKDGLIEQTGILGSRSEARSRFAAAVKDARLEPGNGRGGESSAGGLLQCLRKSNELAQRLYADGENTCMVQKTVTNDGLRLLLEQTVVPPTRYPGNYMTLGSGCYVGDAVQARQKGDQFTQLAVGLKDPSRPVNRSVQTFDRRQYNQFDQIYRVYEADLDKNGNFVRSSRGFERSVAGANNEYRFGVQAQCTDQGTAFGSSGGKVNK